MVTALPFITYIETQTSVQVFSAKRNIGNPLRRIEPIFQTIIVISALQLCVGSISGNNKLMQQTIRQTNASAIVVNRTSGVRPNPVTLLQVFVI